MIGVISHPVTVKACVVTDGKREWTMPLVEALPGFVTAITNQFGDTQSSRLFWTEADAERAMDEAKETLSAHGYIRYIGPAPTHPE
ncbi:hypothetical protein ACRQ1B_03285 [Rhizobium panacihumi]|uniref:hypothetical protein n=1 Tax=Rhizobium panacihumi TaxID=2008450 RepID=UPI003D7A9CAB